MKEIVAVLQHVWQIPAVRHAAAGAFAGILAAARVDYKAFKAMQTIQQFEEYSWRVAAFRWAQGALVGAVGVSGLAALIS